MDRNNFDSYFEELNNFFEDKELDLLFEHLKYFLQLMSNPRTNRESELFHEFRSGSIIGRLNPLLDNERLQALHEHFSTKINKLTEVPSHEALLKIFRETQENYLKKVWSILEKKFDERIKEMK